ncbi:hypothetical protein ACVWZV_002229 [Bradyrhizobium sp. GM5.1]
MHIDGRKVSKGLTEQRIIDALAPGYRLIRVNWKKQKIHVVNGFGNVKIVSFAGVAQ